MTIRERLGVFFGRRHGEGCGGRWLRVRNTMTGAWYKCERCGIMTHDDEN